VSQNGERAERADKDYVQLLHLASQEGESRVEAALQQLLDAQAPLSVHAIRALWGQATPTCVIAQVTVAPVDLGQYDALLSDTAPVTAPVTAPTLALLALPMITTSLASKQSQECERFDQSHFESFEITVSPEAHKEVGKIGSRRSCGDGRHDGAVRRQLIASPTGQARTAAESCPTSASFPLRSSGCRSRSSQAPGRTRRR
jgi:hypothetical protein